MKRTTEGIDPKLIAQLVASAIAWVLARYAGISLPPEAEVGIAAVVPKTTVVPAAANQNVGGV
jgi:hypothetical protein